MNKRTETPSPFAAPTTDQLTGLVFELASQLHVERARRLALEAALEAAGAIAPGAADRIAAQAALRERTNAALDRSMAGIMRVLTEAADPRSPLRQECDSNI
jgi:phage-related minor tail protein